jgi:phage terminase large subunit GpA-like protein
VNAPSWTGEAAARATDALTPAWLRDALSVLGRPPRVGGNEWAERYRQLGVDENRDRAGEWRSFAWQREILDALADGDVERVVILKAAQMGVSELVRCAIGRWALHDPGDVLWVMADEHAAKKAMKKLRAMFANTPALRPLLSTRRSESTLLELRLTNDMRIVIGWAGSAQSLASDPFRYAVVDEVGKYRWKVQGEGSPVGLVEERTKVFGRKRKIVLLSTPKAEDDQIMKAHGETLDRRVFVVPCPSCGHRQAPEIEALRWPDGAYATAPTDPDARVRLAAALERAQSAWIECVKCKGHVQPHLAAEAPAAGWVQEEQVEGERRRAYHVPEWLHWKTTTSDLAARWLRCTHPREITEFWNGSLGLVWKSARVRIAGATFTARASWPRKLVPKWATAVLSTADTQLRGWWYVVRAWGKGGRSQLLDWGFVETEEELLERCVNVRFRVDGGGEMRPLAFAVDTGGGMVTPDGSRTKQVYGLVARTPRARALKGRGDKESNSGAPWTRSKVRLNDREDLELALVNRNYYADEAATLIRATEPILWNECEGVADDPEYVRQMASEELVLVTSGTRSDWLWQKRSKGAANHLWDCSRYQVWLAEMERVETRGDVGPPQYPEQKPREPVISRLTRPGSRREDDDE